MFFIFATGAAAATPEVTSVSPDMKTVGDAEFELTVNGKNFVKGDSVILDPGNWILTTTFVSVTELKAKVPKSYMTSARTAKTVVANKMNPGATFTVNNPVPTLSGISPASKEVGGKDVVVTLTGTGFVSGAAIKMGTKALSATYKNSTTYEVTIPSANVSAGTYDISMTNSAPGGGTATLKDSFVVANPKPKLTKVEYDSTDSSGNIVLKFTGTYFDSKAWGTAKPDKDTLKLTTAFVSSTTLKVTMPLDDFFKDGKIQNIPFAVVNTDGKESDAQPYKLALLKPVLTTLSPSQVAMKTASRTITVTGGNFTKRSRILIGGAERATTWISATSVKFDLADADVAGGGTLKVTATNPEDMVSGAKTLDVRYPKAVMTSWSPKTWTGGEDVILTVEGSGFVPGVTELIYGEGNPFVVRHTAVIPADATDKKFTVTIPGDKIRWDHVVPRMRPLNPDPKEGSDSSQNVTIVIGAPSVDSISPASAELGSKGLKITLKGKNLERQPMTANFGGGSYNLTKISSTETSFTFDIPSDKVSGTLKVGVNYFVNNASLLSNTLDFVLLAPKPKLTKVEFDSFDKDGNVVLKLTGSGFVSGAVGGQKDDKSKAYVTTFVSSTSLKIAVPLDDFFKNGKLDNIPFKVTNPDGNETDAQPYKLALPKPAITALDPSSADVGAPARSVKITGTNFSKKAIVKVDGKERAATWKSSGEMVIEMSADDLASSGERKISVINPEDVASDDAAFKVRPPKPIATSVDPTIIPAGDIAEISTIVGENFAEGAIIEVDYQSGNAGERGTITYTPASLTATKLTFRHSGLTRLIIGSKLYIKVRNPKPFDDVTETLTVTVGYPKPSITSIVSDSVSLGTVQSLDIIINGADFYKESVVKAGGVVITSTYVSNKKLFAKLGATQLSAAGTLAITVTNPEPGGGESNAATFTVRNPKPSLSSISPAKKFSGDADFELTLTGANFTAGSVVRFSGSDRPTTYVDSKTLKANIAAADILYVGSKAVTVFTPEPGGGTSSMVVLSVVNPAPVLDGLSEDTKMIDSAAFEPTLTGSGFNGYSVVRINGVKRAAKLVSSTQMTVSMTADDLKSTSELGFTVFNAAPEGGESGKKILKVVPRPKLVILAPLSGEKLKAGSTYEIKWSLPSAYTTSSIHLTVGEFTTEEDAVDLSEDAGATGSYFWTVPDIDSESNVIVIVARDAAGESIVSEVSGIFAIAQEAAPAPPVPPTGPETPPSPPEEPTEPGGLPEEPTEPGAPPEEPTDPTDPGIPPEPPAGPDEPGAPDEPTVPGGPTKPEPVPAPQPEPQPLPPLPPLGPDVKLPTPPKEPIPGPDLGPGVKGPGLGTLCDFLDSNGFQVSKDCTAFDPEVQKALEAFQDAYTDDGDLGPGTIHFLNSLLRQQQGGACTAQHFPIVPPEKPFTRLLKFGDAGDDVRVLQKFLNDNGYLLGTNGPGAPGQETAYFIDRTRTALRHFQNSFGLLSERGRVGAKNRFFINSLMTEPPVLRCPKLLPPSESLDRDLAYRDRDQEVLVLQSFLNANGFLLATLDYGAASQETTYFGPRTRAALTRFQTAFGLRDEANRLGPKTRAFINALLAKSAGASCGGAGALIKTRDSSTIWYCGRDGKIHSFQSPKIYFSWYGDFSSVKELEGDSLGDMTVGDPVQYRPGIRLVKRTDAAQVYAVDPGRVLRPISDEATAERLYGKDWALRLVDDMPSEFFNGYTIGSPVTQ